MSHDLINDALVQAVKRMRLSMGQECPVSGAWLDAATHHPAAIAPAEDTCGVTPATRDAFAAAGITPEPGSPLQGLMLLYDDERDEDHRAFLLLIARQVHKVAPLASCRVKV